MKAMILAAGLGTRLKPFTQHHPKALAPVNGKTLLQRNVEYLASYGIKEVVVNVHHFADQIVQCVNDNQGWGSSIKISDETDEVLETGGGLVKAQHLLGNEPFVLMNVDILTNLNLQNLISKHVSLNNIATLAVTDRNSSRQFLFDEHMQLCGWRNNTTNDEKIARAATTATPFAFSGIHMISPAIFDKIPYKGKFGMVDVYLHLAATERIVGHNHSGDVLLDVGKPEAIEKAESIFA
jgi:N-acetyl-alpha-D-muramate 1-phosphate uridylyltransferase